MPGSKSNLNNLDVISDIDDQWDDFIEDDASSFENSSDDSFGVKKSPIQINKIIKLMLLISLVVGGGIYITMIFFNKTKKNIPVVKLDNIQNYDDLPKIQKPEIDNNLILNQTDTTDNITLNDDQEDNNNSQEDNTFDSNINVGVLTPMPNKFDDNITLPILESDNTPSNDNILTEDTLLSKTETIFEPDVNQEIENTPSVDDKIASPDLEDVITEDNNILKDNAPISEELITPPILEKPKEIEIHKDLVKPPAKKVIRVNNWIIRAAKSDSAVIYNKTSGEMKTVEVGDFVGGIGSIKSIEKMDSKWRIVGSSGTIK